MRSRLCPRGTLTLALASHLPVTLSQHILFPSGSGLCHPHCHTRSTTEHTECFGSITDEVGIGWKPGIRRLFLIWCPDDKQGTLSTVRCQVEGQKSRFSCDWEWIKMGSGQSWRFFSAPLESSVPVVSNNSYLRAGIFPPLTQWWVAHMQLEIEDREAVALSQEPWGQRKGFARKGRVRKQHGEVVRIQDAVSGPPTLKSWSCTMRHRDLGQASCLCTLLFVWEMGLVLPCIATRIKYKYLVRGMWFVLQACSLATPCKLAIISRKVHHQRVRTCIRTEAAQHKQISTLWAWVSATYDVLCFSNFIFK